MGKDQELLDAARSGNVAVVDKILSQRAKRSGPLASLRRGPGANVQDSNGYTPLHHAALNGHKEIVRLLLASDASPSLAGGSGATPLHLASWAGHADIVRALLAHPAPPHVDQITKDNETALQMAAQYGHTAVVAQLLARGADPAVRNVRDESALDLAAQYGRLETVEMLVRTHPELLEAYRLPGARSRLYEHTPLHRASRNGHKEVVCVLAAAGVDVNARTAAGTSLHEAALCGKARVVHALLARGADPSLPDGRGRTPLDLLRVLPAHATKHIVNAINKHRFSNGYDSESEDLPAVPLGEPGSPYDNVRSFPSGAPGGLSPSQLWEPRDEDRRRTSAVSMDEEKSSDRPPPQGKSSSIIKHSPNSYMLNFASKCFGLNKSKSANDVSSSSFPLPFPFRDRKERAKNHAKERQLNIDNSKDSATSTIRIGRSKFFKRRSRVADAEDDDDDDDDEFLYVPGNRLENDGLVTIQRVNVINRSKRSISFKSSLPNISEKTEFASIVGIDSSSDSISNSLYTSDSIDDVDASNENRKKLYYAQLDFTPVDEATADIKKVEEHEYELYDFQEDAPKPLKRTVFLESQPRPNSSESESTSSYDSIIDGTRFEDILNSQRSDSFVFGSLYENVNASRVRDRFKKSEVYYDTISSQSTEHCDSDAEEPPGYVSMGTIPKVRRFSDGQIRNPFFVDRNLLKREDKSKSVHMSIEDNNKFGSVPKVKNKRVSYHLRGSGDCIYDGPDNDELVYVLNRRSVEEHGLEPFYKVSVYKVGEFDRPICFCDGGTKKMHMSAEDLYSEVENNAEDNVSFTCYCDGASCKHHHSVKKEEKGDVVARYSNLKESVSFPNLLLPESLEEEENHYAVSDLLAEEENHYAVSDLLADKRFSVASSDYHSLRSSAANSDYYTPTDSFRFFQSRPAVPEPLYANVGSSSSLPLRSHGGRSLFHVTSSGADYSHPKYYQMDGSYNGEADRASISSTASSTGGAGPREPRQRCGTSDSSVSGGRGHFSAAPGYHAHSPGSNNKVSPTPPKKPPRRNLSVSPTHGGGTAAQYLARAGHARSQDDLDDYPTGKQSLRHGRSVDQYVDIKSESQTSPSTRPTPNPRPSLMNRNQPVAISAMYENVVIKTQNPKRKLRRNQGHQYENCEPRGGAGGENGHGRYASSQERSSMESLLDDCGSGNTPSDGETAGYGRLQTPLSPTHYRQPPTPDHPPPSATQAEHSIHERIRPLSQEYKRRSYALRDSTTETEIHLLRAASSASVTSGGTDRSASTDCCVEEYVCDVPFAGLFKGSTTTLDGIGLRPTPAERPKTLKKLKNVYEPPASHPAPNYGMPNSNHGVNSNGNSHHDHRNSGTNYDRLEPSHQQGGEEVIRRTRTNTNTSNQSVGDKSLSILSPFDEQEEWAKISEIMASFGSRIVRESVFVTELEQEFQSRLGLSCSESSLSASVGSTVGQWLAGLSLPDLESRFMMHGFDELDFINDILDEADLKEMSIDEPDRSKILEASKSLPPKITEIASLVSGIHIHNNKSAEPLEVIDTVDYWLRLISLEQYSDTFRKHLYVDMERVKRIWEVELTAVLEIQKIGHRKRILASVSGQQNGPLTTNIEDINADLTLLKTNIQQLKEEIKEKIPPTSVPAPSLQVSQGGETLKRSHKKNRPPPPPKGADLEIRAPSELLVGVPGALKAQWRHQPLVLVSGAVTYVANYLGSTVVKELRGTESTKKSIQKLKKTTREPRDSPDIILSISYRGVKFLNTITRDLVCEHEIRNIHCACQDADDLTHFAYITKDHTTKHHYCHVFCVATMDQATEVILTLGEAFEVAYQMALKEQFNVKGTLLKTQPKTQAKTPTHDPTTISSIAKDKPNPNHGRSHSITEIKLNGHQLKVVTFPGSLSNEDFQTSRNGDAGSRSPRTPGSKAPIASTEEL